MQNNKNLYNIYCDESCHLENDSIDKMVIGAVWCLDKEKHRIYNELREIKKEHGLSKTFELKWNKVSNGKVDYYLDIIKYYFKDNYLNYRALVVPNKKELNHSLYNQTHNDFIYKMYFDLLKVIFDPQNTYKIFLDIKDTKGQKKIEKLLEILCNSTYDFNKLIIKDIQLVDSKDVELIQLSDFLSGAICYANRGLQSSEAKMQIIKLIQSISGKTLFNSTLVKENKMNIFIWKGSKTYADYNI